MPSKSILASPNINQSHSSFTPTLLRELSRRFLKEKRVNQLIYNNSVKFYVIDNVGTYSDSNTYVNKQISLTSRFLLLIAHL